MDHRWCWVLLLALLAADLGAAPIYRTVDENGNVVFTDDPGDREAEEVDLPALTIIPGAALPELPAASTEEEEDELPWEVELVSPGDQDTVRSNLGDLSVAARSNRPLEIGYRFELLLDGTAQDQNDDGDFALTGIDRGAHEVSVNLLDAAGDVVARSPTHTIYLHRRSRLHP